MLGDVMRAAPSVIDVESRSAGESPFLPLWQEVERAGPRPARFRSLRIMGFDRFRDIVFCGDEGDRREIVHSLYAGDGFVLKGAVDPGEVTRIIDAAYSLGLERPQSFHKMLDGCPDFNRMIDHELTKRYAVTAIKHSYYFFPWNDDPIRIMRTTYDIWPTFKYLGGVAADAYQHNKPLDGVVDRVQVVRYPAGGGELRRHTDPIKNQRVIIGVIMSKRGVDYQSGGFFFVDEEGNKRDFEDILDVGDMVCSYGTVEHGVTIVDPEAPLDWQSRAGRWFLGLYSNDSDHVRERKTTKRVAE